MNGLWIARFVAVTDMYLAFVSHRPFGPYFVIGMVLGMGAAVLRFRLATMKVDLDDESET